MTHGRHHRQGTELPFVIEENWQAVFITRSAEDGGEDFHQEKKECFIDSQPHKRRETLMKRG